MQMQLQRQPFLLSYFKTPSDAPAGIELMTFRMTARCSTNGATGARINNYDLLPYLPKQEHKTQARFM